MKKYILLFLVLLLTNCKNFFYGTTRGFYYVDDYNYWFYGVPSYQVNTNDRYCVFFTGLTTNYDKEEKNKQQIFSFLESKNIKITKEPLFRFDGKIYQDDTIKIIKQREINNNFKNCNYLLSLDLSNGIKNKKSIYFNIDIYDIKSDKRIGSYTMHEDDTIFNKKTQEQKIEKMLNEWWKTQIKPQPKARPLETWCVGNCDNKKD